KTAPVLLAKRPVPKAELQPALPVSRNAVASSAPAADASTRITAPTNKLSAPLSHSAQASGRAAAPASSLGIEISSAIAPPTLAVFVARQLLPTSPPSVTRPGESLHLDRSLPIGPHELRVALYRQDKTLQIEKEGLAELEPGLSNQLIVRVVR